MRKEKKCYKVTKRPRSLTKCTLDIGCKIFTNQHSNSHHKIDHTLANYISSFSCHLIFDNNKKKKTHEVD